MALFKATFNGYLPCEGIVFQGNIIEYNGPKLGWLEPLKGKGETVEQTTRQEVCAELKKLNIPFFKGASLEQLQAILATNKGQLT